MIKTKCLNCKKTLWRFPSMIQPRNYCSRECHQFARKEEWIAIGKPYQFNRKRSKEFEKKRIKAIKEKMTNENHPMWKGTGVSYRGLHQWIRRKKGKPIICSNCGKKSKKPRVIQWANTDGKYRRVLSDYIALCCSCHKFHDLKLKSIRDVRAAR